MNGKVIAFSSLAKGLPLIFLISLGFAVFPHVTFPAKYTFPPKDLSQFWSGEESYDAARGQEIAKAVKENCENLKPEEKKLRAKYQGDRESIQYLDKTVQDYKDAFGSW